MSLPRAARVGLRTATSSTSAPFARAFGASSRQLSSSPSSSSSAQSNAASASTSSSSAAAAAAATTSKLPWSTYLQLRKQRRLAGTLTTVPSMLLAGSTTASVLLSLEGEPFAGFAGGIDPLFIYAGLTLSATGLGYLLGPTLGTSLWSLFHRRNIRTIEAMDQDFYDHIKRNRVDPSRQTMQNRLPDYYGEKIGSVADYRRWLRDQAAFRRKAAHGVEDDEKLL